MLYLLDFDFITYNHFMISAIILAYCYISCTTTVYLKDDEPLFKVWQTPALLSLHFLY